jgi:hypothetical protein
MRHVSRLIQVITNIKHSLLQYNRRVFVSRGFILDANILLTHSRPPRFTGKLKDKN